MSKSKMNPSEESKVSTPESTGNPYFKFEIKDKLHATFVIGAIFAIFGFILGELSLPKFETNQPVTTKWGRELQTVVTDSLVQSHQRMFIMPTEVSHWSYNFLLAAVFFMLGFVATEYYFERNSPIFHEFKKRLDELETLMKTALDDLAKHQEKTLDDIRIRQDKTIELAAFYTDGQELEKNAIGILRSKKGGVVWIAAKFISKQLTESFSTLKFDINGNDYSKFSEDLYRECKKFIYLTSPFTPAEWFRQLYSGMADQVIEKIQQSKNESDQILQLPNHVQALVDSKATVKRIVVIPKGGWNTIVAQKKLLKKFLEMNGRIENRFITKEDLVSQYHFTEYPDFDFSRYDYAIFEKELLFKWERPFGDEKKALELIDLMSDTRDSARPAPYNEIVEDMFEFKRAKFLDADQILAEIETKKAALKRDVCSIKEVPHKLAYFTTGANAWLEISCDPNYELGRREQSTLQQFILTALSQERSPWNVYHIGPGNGREIPDVVNSLSVALIKKYILLDISPELLHAAEQVGRTNCVSTKFFSEICDIVANDIEDIRKKHSELTDRNLFLLVANGAILSNPSALPNIRRSMNKDDTLLVTVAVQENDDILFKELQMESIFNLLVEPLRILGIDDMLPAHLAYEYNRGTFMLEVYFKFNEWIATAPTMAGEFNGFPERIKIFGTLRPTLEGLKNLLEKNGFICADSDIHLFKDERCLAARCKKS